MHTVGPMPLVLIIIGSIMIVSAFKNTQGQLGTALEQDIPGFLKWAAAIFAIGLIGYIPRMQPISRALLTLVVTVIVLTNYQQIINSFKNLSPGAGAAPQPTAAQATPATAYTQAAEAQPSAGAGGTSVAGGLGSGLQQAASAAGSIGDLVTGGGFGGGLSDIPILGGLFG